jgi:hypothetical protein
MPASPITLATIASDDGGYINQFLVANPSTPHRAHAHFHAPYPGHCRKNRDSATIPGAPALDMP